MQLTMPNYVLAAVVAALLSAPLSFAGNDDGEAKGPEKQFLDQYSEYTECIPLTRKLVDLPDPAHISRKALEWHYDDLSRDLAGSSQQRRWNAISISNWARSLGGKAIFRPGLVDSFLPVYIVTDKTFALC